MLQWIFMGWEVGKKVLLVCGGPVPLTCHVMEIVNTGLKNALLQLLFVHESCVSDVYQMYQYVTTLCGLCHLKLPEFWIDSLQLSLVAQMQCLHRIGMVCWSLFFARPAHFNC